jgi:hypothetical protein
VENGHDVAVIEYHGGDGYETTESMYRISNYYGLTGYPTAWFDGILTHVGGNQTQSLYQTYLPLYEERAAKISVFELDAVPEYTGGNNFNFTITANNIYPYPGQNVVLQAVATESHIPDNWLGLDEVNFVCRKMLPDQMGTALDFGSQSTYEVDLSFTWNNSWNIDEMDLVVFLQDNDTKEILQAILVEDLGMYVGIDDVEAAAETSIFPNPASDVVNIVTDSKLHKVRILNNNGQEVLNRMIDGQTLQINTTDYQPGVYFIEIRTNDGVVTKKLVIR